MTSFPLDVVLLNARDPSIIEKVTQLQKSTILVIYRCKTEVSKELIEAVKGMQVLFVTNLSDRCFLSQETLNTFTIVNLSNTIWKSTYHVKDQQYLLCGETLNELGNYLEEVEKHEDL
ncbi:hypothetical protein FGO68_gene6967 [Halteria grandinella]|uniref:Uncharacterized protein n=1 Tax=Halteria grandinella TaxID=5974 RepID=A0A8J8NSB0_HALGN|nr:hypothetical protein FGO68_gene6967 [Halteria grandinella]